jgi:outer membrane lipoprotein-sorting protein
MKRSMIVVVSLLTFFPLCLQAQAQDREAEKIMDKLSKAIASYKCLYFEYTLRIEDVQLNTSELRYGKVLTKGNKFKLSTNNLDVYSDGTNQWQYLKEENEVTVSLADPESDDLMSNPVGFITGNRKEYKQSLKGEVNEGDLVLTEIDFYPRDLKTPYSYVRVRINEKKQVPYSIKYVGKDGVHYTIRINNYAPDTDVPDDGEFVFDVAKHQDVIVNDLRG